MSAGAVAGAAARRAERRLIQHLREAGAVAPSSACAIPDQRWRWMGRRVVRRLVAAGAVREVPAGFYLDEASYAAYRARRTRLVLTIMGSLAAVAVLVSLVVWWASRG